jgi:hypothetical protein
VNIQPIDPDLLEVGQDVTAWYLPTGSHGQGGVVHKVGQDAAVLLSGTAGILNVIPWDEVHHWTIELPYGPEDCLERGPDCEGQVGDWYTSGPRSWPRCDFHGNRRMDAYENSMERYADSDVVPSWFDPSYAGEHWDDDY